LLTSILVAARRHRRLVATVIYAGLAVVSLGLAFLTRFDFQFDALLERSFPSLALLLVVVRFIANQQFRLAFGRWRFVGTRDFLRLFGSLTVGSALFWGASWLLPMVPNAPRSIVLLEWVFSGYLTGGTWIAYRLMYERTRIRQAQRITRVLVVGAGEAGQLIVHQMLRSKSGMFPVSLVDDDPLKWGALIHGVEVVGSTAHLPEIVESARPDQVLIAIPSATADELRRIVEAGETTGLPLKILPGIEDVLEGHADLTQIRPVRVEDLLGRDPVQFELPEVAHELRDKTVLVTGAAGSIGSELVRQIALHRPRTLVLLDQAETPLYFLDLELRRLFPTLNLVAAVGSVTDLDTVRDVTQRFQAQRVFHAAAYKHVPMMEGNCREAVRTNVVGTYLMGHAAAAGGAEAFLLISTDKAVRPSNVMGATKQLAERVVLSLQARYPECAFRAVRFGNVLGSSGSVIPVFRQQLERGDPLTVTHEDVTRYFMTIPEAVQLVLQASVLRESRGRVSMLDMGSPIKILDLARNLLRLSGRSYRPGENVVISGLRPGEKLHEELTAPEERVSPTSADRVSIVEVAPGFPQLPAHVLAALAEAEMDVAVEYLLTEFPNLDRRHLSAPGNAQRV
jgi:FlaA1/EpsC-like NDP-sugar epimerase